MANISGRFSAVDALRGLIMMIMAIDHASAFVARQHSTEFWNGAVSIYSSAFVFLTRWITHLCAPGFFFLMGAGAYWFAKSRLDSGWSEAQVIRRAAVRGLVLLLCGQTLENGFIILQSLMPPAAVPLSRLPMPPPNDGLTPYWGFVTLSCLGVVMMVCAAMLWLRPWVWLVVSALCVYATNSWMPASGKVGPLWETILLAPGLSQHVIVPYAVIPWLAVGAAGMYFGYWWRTYPGSHNRVWMVGGFLAIFGILLRALGGWGNIVQPRDASWIEFLNNVKYPPSLVFWTMSVGINLLLLAALMRLPEAFRAARSPLMVFGQTPLFFYILHFYTLAAISYALFQSSGSLEMAYFVWAVVLVMLYPVCARYRKFKTAQPAESVWRLF